MDEALYMEPVQKASASVVDSTALMSSCQCDVAERVSSGPGGSALNQPWLPAAVTQRQEHLAPPSWLVHRAETVLSENGGKWLHPWLFFLLFFWVLGVHPLRTDKVAFGFENAPALDDDGVAEDPLQPPAAEALVPRSLPHGLQEGLCRHQLCKKNPEWWQVCLVFRIIHCKSFWSGESSPTS